MKTYQSSKKTKIIKKILGLLLVLVSIIIFIQLTKIVNFTQRIYEFENKKEYSLLGQFQKILFPSEVSLKGESQGRINILFLGIAGDNRTGSLLTDTIMLLSLDVSRKKIALISIPRDLYIQVPELGYWTRINAVYQLGKKNNTQGKDNSKEAITLLAKTIKEITGAEIEYYVLLDFKGFEQIVDGIGGVDFYLERDIYDPTFPNANYGYEPFHLKAGQHHLDGELALKIVRSRHSIYGDFDRIKRQHQILQQIYQKITAGNFLQDIFSLNNFLEELGKNLKTNISLAEMRKLWEMVKGIKSEDITSIVIDNNPIDGPLKSANINGAQVLLPKNNNFEQIQKIVKNVFEEKFAKKEQIASANLNHSFPSQEINNEEKTEEIEQNKSNQVKGEIPLNPPGSTDSTSSPQASPAVSPSTSFRINSVERSPQVFVKGEGGFPENPSVEIKNGSGWPDLANQLAKKLEENGYKVIKTSNIEELDFSGVIIYDYTGDNLNKKNSRQFLEKQFDTEIIPLPHDETMVVNNKKRDFLIILGKVI